MPHADTAGAAARASAIAAHANNKTAAGYVADAANVVAYIAAATKTNAIHLSINVVAGLAAIAAANAADATHWHLLIGDKTTAKAIDEGRWQLKKIIDAIR